MIGDSPCGFKNLLGPLRVNGQCDLGESKSYATHLSKCGPTNEIVANFDLYLFHKSVRPTIKAKCPLFVCFVLL